MGWRWGGVGRRVASVAAVVGLCGAASPLRAQTAADLSRLSLEELSNVRVTTVSRREESLEDAPASTYVITHEEIARSGARTLPEILRLAPNLTVARSSASGYEISARGLLGDPTYQDFANKLLVMIDGRSIYTPLFSGVYWDLQGLLPEDIDHIEVISGPAGALWGANAVAGVVNIITRSAATTRSGLAVADAGSREDDLGLRVGGEAAGASYRLYAHAHHEDDFTSASGAPLGDRYSSVQAGFRFDWALAPRDALSLHGDILTGDGPTLGAIGANNLTVNYTHGQANGDALTVQAYFDEERHGHDLTGGLPLLTDAVDLDLQDALRRGPNDVVLGFGVRSTLYRFTGVPNFTFDPLHGDLNVVDLFAEDTLHLTKRLRLILGLKGEDDPYTGWTPLPSARLAWSATSSTFFWAAVSRAVRSATPFDVDVRELVGGQVFLTGDPNFRPERVWAAEAGARLQPSPRLSASVSLFYNLYDDFRSIERSPTGLPIRWGNEARGRGYGLESWIRYRVLPFWRLGASLDLLTEHFSYLPGSAALGGVAEITDDPKLQASLTSSFELPGGASFDAALRRQGALPAPFVPAYTELNLNLVYPLTPRISLGLAGFNLIHERHVEIVGGEPVPRSVLGELKCRF